MTRIVLDFETRSMADLKKVGAYNYSMHRTTQPTCLAVKSDKMSHVALYDFELVNRPFNKHHVGIQGEWRALIQSGALFVAHNAFFEMVIYKNIMVKRYGWPDIPFKQWRCTAAKASACALPRSLEGVGQALDLAIQKDRRGYQAMMATCQPTREWRNWNQAKEAVEAGKKVGSKKQELSRMPEPPVFLTPETGPDVFNTLYEYCEIDVKTEALLDEALPDLNPFEQEVWFLNQQINWRGVTVDAYIIHTINVMLEYYGDKHLEELDALTMGLVTKGGARQDLIDWLKVEGVDLCDLKAKTVSDILQNGELSDDAKRLLEIRQALSKASTKKYQAFLNRADPHDHRIRDILLYHGASTGRDSGTGVQIQNLPRPLISQTRIDQLLELLREEPRVDSAWVEAMYGHDLSIAFSALLRSMIIPSRGRELFVADYSKIEVAVLWWLADNEAGLEILRSGQDPYVKIAMINTGKKEADITSDDRQLGKAQILGAGFGMSPKKFKQAAFDMYRLDLTEKQAKDAIENYRNAYPNVVKLWHAYEEAALFAVEERRAVRAGKCRFEYKDDFLWVTLPSQRRLAYFKPHVFWRETGFGPQKTLEFLGLAPNKKELRTEGMWFGKYAENITQAVARDLMVNAELNLERAGYQVLMPVHDEIISERVVGERSIEQYIDVMCTKPNWADDKLPLEAKGYKSFRYRK